MALLRGKLGTHARESSETCPQAGEVRFPAWATPATFRATPPDSRDAPSSQEPAAHAPDTARAGPSLFHPLQTPSRSAVLPLRQTRTEVSPNAVVSRARLPVPSRLPAGR